MSDIKSQLEYFRDNRRNALAVITIRGDAEKVAKTFPRTRIKDAEQYAERLAPSRITDMRRGMEVIRVYLSKEGNQCSTS